MLKEDHIRKIKYNIGYKINESAKYKKIEEDELEFDEIPNNLYSTEDGTPTPYVGGTDLTEENEEVPEDDKEEVEADLPPADVEIEDKPIEKQGEPVNPEPANDDVEISNQQQSVDDIQNEVIKHNIQAMKDINDKINQMDLYVDKFNKQLELLSSKVKEVEEPTNAEKLKKQKEVSYPFNFNLNDYWKDNWFEQRNNINNNNIKQLEDGSYIAAYDDLPTHSDKDIEDSFNNII